MLRRMLPRAMPLAAAVAADTFDAMLRLFVLRFCRRRCLFADDYFIAAIFIVAAAAMILSLMPYFDADAFRRFIFHISDCLFLSRHFFSSLTPPMMPRR